MYLQSGSECGFWKDTGTSIFRIRKYFSADNLSTLYKIQIEPRLEYYYNDWGAAAPTTLALVDVVRKGLFGW